MKNKLLHICEHKILPRERKTILYKFCHLYTQKKLGIPIHKWSVIYKASLYKRMEWIRAPSSGLFLPEKELNSLIIEGETLGKIVDPFAIGPAKKVLSNINGVIIAKTTSPLVNEGPLFHIAKNT